MSEYRRNEAFEIEANVYLVSRKEVRAQAQAQLQSDKWECAY
jgi:hypothetical protein